MIKQYPGITPGINQQGLPKDEVKNPLPPIENFKLECNYN
jgi:hypothetical protein